MYLTLCTYLSPQILEFRFKDYFKNYLASQERQEKNVIGFPNFSTLGQTNTVLKGGFGRCSSR